MRSRYDNRSRYDDRRQTQQLVQEQVLPPPTHRLQFLEDLKPHQPEAGEDQQEAAKELGRLEHELHSG